MRPLVTSYEELRLRLDRGEGNSYRVLATTRAAEVSASFELPFSELEIENFVLRVSRPRGRRRFDSSALGDAKRFGGQLFDALFSDRVQRLYNDALTEARGGGRGLRITLCLSGSPELIAVPWEYLFDAPDFLAVSSFTPVVRYLDLPRGHRPLAVEPPLRILGVVSSPAEYERLDVESERTHLEGALASLTEAGAVELRWLERPTLEALLLALQADTFHVLHYVGHGSFDRELDHGLLLFEDDGGWARAITGDQLGMVLRDFTSLRLAVLNACEGARTARSDPFAGVAASLVQRDIPAVIAMQFEISDEAAIVFAKGFYSSVAIGSPVDAALATARLAMFARRSDDIEWGTPALFMRVPDGRIFNLADPGPSRSPRALDGSGARRSLAFAGAAGRRSERETLNGPLTVFVNYRREDSPGDARLLYDRLQQRFGSENVRFDVPLEPVMDELQTSGANEVHAAVFLALIGPRWVSTLRGRRTSAISQPGDDLGRWQIEWALRDWPGPVVPVVADASMPPAEMLPRSLRGLCRKRAAELRHASFDHDMAVLIERLERIATEGSDMPRRQGTTTAQGKAHARREGLAKTVQIASGVPVPHDDHYASVIASMIDGTVTPVLGSRVRGSLPDAEQLAAHLATTFQIEAKSHDLAEVAQYVAVTKGQRRLYTAMKEVFASEPEPTDVHLFLAAFPRLLREMGFPSRPQLIISTSYDRALELAFEDANEPFDYAVFMADSGWFVHVPWGELDAAPLAVTITEPQRYADFPIDDYGELDRTVIVKIHGATDGQEGGLNWVNNYVVTEDQYIDYLPTDNVHRLVPFQILDKLKSSRCLFLGYPMHDWNARVFLRRIWRGESMSEKSWAVQSEPDVLERDSWGLIGHVELLAASLPEYVAELRARLIAGAKA